MIIAYFFGAYILYLFFCLIQDKRIRDKKEQEWEPHRYKPQQLSEEEKMIREMEEEHLDDINPWSWPL